MDISKALKMLGVGNPQDIIEMIAGMAKSQQQISDNMTAIAAHLDALNQRDQALSQQLAEIAAQQRAVSRQLETIAGYLLRGVPAQIRESVT